MKRFFDFFISLALIIVLSPLMIILSILIKLDSTGPVFHHQKSNGQPALRLGKNAKPFFYFKFRSMFVNTDNVTNFGAFIRRWHLDELPELFQVLIGKMSLVGPRPLEKSCVKRKQLEYYQSLLTKPGMTGYMQIHRKESNCIEEHINANKWYFENKGFLTDSKILIKTPFAIMLQKSGSKKTMILL